jgi:hypothetical protein
MHSDMGLVYLSSQNPAEFHPASPLIDFILELSQFKSTRRAILDSRFLDLLLWMYICDFNIYNDSQNFQDITKKGPSAHSGAQSVSHKSRDFLLETCSVALSTLYQHPDGLAAIQGHHIHVLWPRAGSLCSEFGDRTNERAQKWWELGRTRTYGPDHAIRRVQSLSELLSSYESRKTAQPTMLTDLCIDLVAFTK